MGAEDNRIFQNWLNSEYGDAYFFLDAVDELKLRKGSWRVTLNKLQRLIGPNIDRVRLFVSCRPLDWNDEIDIEELKSWLTQGIEVQERKHTNTISTSGEDVFLSAIKQAADSNTESSDTTNKPAKRQVKTLALLPLSQSEITEFASLYRPTYVEKLKQVFEKNELWHLYQAPADIMDALDLLHANGQLGSLEEQLRFGIESKLKETSNKKRNALSIAKAKEGAERIALALFLIKQRSIQLHGNQNEGFDVAKLLTDWAQTDIEELLGRPIFDPTGVGSVRFHHRSTQEFLAASRLKLLLENGLSRADLNGLLFNEVSGERVTIPSMEPITAWLALWDSDILREVVERKPTLLFREGLPASMNVDLRAKLLRRYVELYANSEWRGVGVGHSELKRVASPELGAVVRELWSTAYTGEDTREIFLELIWLTPLRDCLDLAYQAAFDKQLPPHHRVYACWSITQFGSSEQKKALGTSILKQHWPERVVWDVMPYLLPESLTVEQFARLSLAQQETPNTVYDLSYSLYQTMKSDDISDAIKVELRNRFTNAVWENRRPESKIYQAHSNFHHLNDAILTCCNAIRPHSDKEIAVWTWSLCVAFHFSKRHSSTIAIDDTNALRKLLNTNTAFKEAFYWACFEFAEQIEDSGNDWERFINTDYETIRPLKLNDIPWLLTALGNVNQEERRGTAFYALSGFIRAGEKPDLSAEIKSNISDRLDLLQELEKALNPPKREPQDYEVERIRRKKKNKNVKKKSGSNSGWNGAERF